MDNLTEKIEAYKNQISIQRKAYFDYVKESLLTVSEQVFEKYPTLVSWSWTQSTNYFNDGESTPFKRNINGLELSSKNDDLYREIYQLMSKLFYGTPIEYFEMNYGEDAKVTVTRDLKFNEEEYCEC